MNRRQQPAPRPVSKPTPQRQQVQQQPPQRQQVQQQQQQRQYVASNTPGQLPPQVSIPQAISILAARINHLEDKCGAETLVDTTGSDETLEKMEDMSKRIVKLEAELVTAKDIILRLQAFAITNATTAKQLVEIASDV